ncbi:MAG: lipopolysaccharide assembly protein LapB [Janthinobacterium lividum]
MDLDYWWLLVIPIVFGLGWVAARFDLKHLLSESAALPRSYFRGLNFLLNEQQDKAIDAFIEVVKLDPETTELHFALGSLFRRRGETERAIRVHQNLLNRADLPTSERDHALYELGLDFLKAGLLDRAEQTLQSIQEGAFANDAQASLLTIYEIEKEWQRAIETAQRLEEIGARDLRKEVAQFHCELASEALQRKDAVAARRALQAALAVNPQSTRAAVLLGDVEMAGGNAAAALRHWTGIESQNPAYLSLVGEKLIAAYAALGRQDEGIAQLVEYSERHPSSDLLDIAFRYLEKNSGIESAHAFARHQMERSPSLSGMTRLLEAQTASAEEPRRSELKLIHALIVQRTKNLPRYTCQHCGFRARLFYWQCPGCGNWETYAPRRIEAMPSS